MRKTRIAGAILGAAAAAALVAGPASADTGTSGNGSVLGGNQVQIPVNAPINLCGNGVGVLGLGAGLGPCTSTSGNSL